MSPRKIFPTSIGGTDWMDWAACKGMDPNLFFPNTEETTKTGYREKVEEAREVCRGCGVAEECRDFGIANHEPGIWGGTTERARKTEVTRRRRHRPSRSLQIYRGTPDDPLASWVNTVRELAYDGEATWRVQQRLY